MCCKPLLQRLATYLMMRWNSENDDKSFWDTLPPRRRVFSGLSFSPAPCGTVYINLSRISGKTRNFKREWYKIKELKHARFRDFFSLPRIFFFIFSFNWWKKNTVLQINVSQLSFYYYYTYAFEVFRIQKSDMCVWPCGCVSISTKLKEKKKKSRRVKI